MNDKNPFAPPPSPRSNGTDPDRSASSDPAGSSTQPPEQPEAGTDKSGRSRSSFARIAPPGSRKPDQPPSPEQLADLRSATWRFILVMLLFAISIGFPVPFLAIAPVLGIVAIVLGFQLVRVMLKNKVTGIVFPMVWIGTFLALVMLFQSGSQLLMWNELRTYQECSSSAITNSAQDRCTGEYEQAVQERLASLGLASSPAATDTESASPEESSTN